MFKFKVGQQVICNSNLVGQFTSGKIYVISKVYNEGQHERISVEKDDAGDRNGWCSDNFDAIPKDDFPAEEIRKLKQQFCPKPIVCSCDLQTVLMRTGCQCGAV